MFLFKLDWVRGVLRRQMCPMNFLRFSLVALCCNFSTKFNNRHWNLIVEISQKVKTQSNLTNSFLMLLTIMYWSQIEKCCHLSPHGVKAQCWYNNSKFNTNFTKFAETLNCDGVI